MMVPGRGKLDVNWNIDSKAGTAGSHAPLWPAIGFIGLTMDLGDNNYLSGHFALKKD